MARCNDCNKFVSYEGDEEPEDDQEFEAEQIDDGLVKVTGSMARLLNCGECGSELKRATIEFEEEIPFEHDAGCPTFLDDEDEKHEDPDFEVEAEMYANERSQTHDRHGKPIKNYRYRRTFYGIEGTATITCTHCQATAEVELTGEEQASAFEETY